MLPIVTFPLHDKDGLLFAHLEKITPDLKTLYSKAVVSITPPTLEFKEGSINKLKEDDFFSLVNNEPGSQVGDHFLKGFAKATEIGDPEQIVHLCTLDRLSFALETKHKDTFLESVNWSEKQKDPVMFLRSSKAWATHPENYYAIESMATRLGEILFNRTLDFAWCHLVLKSSLLKSVLSKFETHDLTAFAELALFFKDQWVTQDVDWLSWEDPYIFDKDPSEYKAERENLPDENKKRLGYINPIIELILTKTK